MASSYSSGIVVRHSEPQLVVPAEPTPSEVKQLSDIDDQEGLRMHLSFIMFYESNQSTTSVGIKNPSKVIKRAISQALVPYYPLAGRLIQGPNRKLLVDCCAEGVLFVEAEADVTLKQLGDSIAPPCPYRKDFLCHVPGSEAILGTPLLLIQVTRFSCGGFAFAVRMNHVVCDSFGLVQFLNKVGTTGASHQPPPVWEREIFSARNPPRVTCTHHEYEDVTVAADHSALGRVAHESFFFGPKQILSLRKRLPHTLQKCSTFELLSACLWKCRTVALDLDDPNEVVGLSCFITAHGKVKVPNGYYGNAFVFPTALSQAALLCRNPLEYALGLIREAKGRMNEEYVRSVVDLMVLKGRPMHRKGWNFFVGDLTRVGFERVDFGWGKPIYGGPVGAIPFISYLARFRNSRGEDGIVVPILLPQLVMERFLLELKKITTDDDDEDQDLNNIHHRKNKTGTKARSML